MTNPPPAPRVRAARAGPAPRAAAAGFTFVELIVVMGVIAVVAAMGIGFLQNLGRASRSLQAAHILSEAGFECRNRSVGGRVATLFLETENDENDNPQVVVSQAVQRPILTSHFEDEKWFVNAAGPATAAVEGPVTLDPDGKSGSAVALGRGGRLDFGTQAAFAPSDGIEISVWVKPASGFSSGVVLEGGDAYQLWLKKSPALSVGGDQYEVELRLKLVDPADASRVHASQAQWAPPWVTTGAPVMAGKWSEILASFDGARASLRVDGVERLSVPAAPTARRAAAAASGPAAGRRRFPAPDGGGVHLTLSSVTHPYAGSVDTLFVQGIFRSNEDRRVLDAGLSLERPRLPAAIRFHNGRLDPLVHRADATIVLRDDGDPEGGRYLVRYGLYGLVSPPRTLVAGEDAEPAPATTPGATSSPTPAPSGEAVR